MRPRAPRSSSLTTRAIWTVRAVARAPRLMALLAAGVLAVVGLKTLLDPAPRSTPMTRDAATRDAAAAGFAEAFARAYFMFDINAPEARQASIARFMPRSAAAGADSGPRRSEQVRWTAVAAESWRGPRRGIVTVAVETATSFWYLAVPVARDERGLLYVPLPRPRACHAVAASARVPACAPACGAAPPRDPRVGSVRLGPAWLLKTFRSVR